MARFGRTDGLHEWSHERHFLSRRTGHAIDWNTNILNNSALVGTLGFTVAQVTSITNDYTLTVYLLSNVGEMAGSTYGALHGFARAMERNAVARF